MSKGHGKIERRLLEILDKAADDENDSAVLPTTNLIARVFIENPRQADKVIVTRSQIETVRRALRRLERKGAIINFSGRLWRNKCCVQKAIGKELLEGLEQLSRRGGFPSL